MRLAGCIIKDADNRILLIHRSSPERTQWEIPGGTIEDSETPEQAAVREAKEELDVTVVIVREIGSKSFEEDGAHHGYHWFEAAITQGKPRLTDLDDDEHDAIDYFSVDDMQHKLTELSANTSNLLRAVQNKEIVL